MDRERIGKYRILDEIGRGTMGEVYKAFDSVLQRDVALKTLSGRVGPDDEALQRFHREAQAAALLNHPNIVTVHDFGEEQGLLYMAMEFLDGTDLRHAIDNDTLGGLDRQLEVMDGLLAALEYAHSRGIVHRDIKPANIFIRRDGAVKITDFGLAKVNTSEMTQEGIVLGTPNYMSPEQALGDVVDGRSDIFSAGAVLYELLTGHKPFEADSTPSVLYQVVHREAPPVRRWAPHVSAPLVAICNQALAKDKERRFAGASAMRSALSAAQRAPQPATSSTLRPPPLPPSHSGRTRHTPPSSVPPIQHPAPEASAPSASGPIRPGRRQALVWVAAGATLALVVLLVFTAPWVRGRLASGGAPAAGQVQVGELTRALVATQVQLAQRELDDKNWQAADTQARSALRLAPGHSEAVRILESAQARLGELEGAVAAARSALAAGETEAASAHLSRLLELDPRHPAAAELTARLNAVFRTQATEAGAAMRAAREGARRGGAAGTREFAAAEAAARDAEGLVVSEDFADATRIFLEARDAFDRAGRSARSQRAAVEPSPANDAPRAAPVQATPTREALRPTAPPAEAAPGAPRFVAEGTTVNTPAAGKIAGFDSENVDARQAPRFEGHLEFEVLPSEVRPGEPFVVRVQLVNEGRRSVRIEDIALATVENGRRTVAPSRVLQRRAPAGERALVAEYSAVWSPVRFWTLEVVAAVEGNEQVQSRLRAE